MNKNMDIESLLNTLNQCIVLNGLIQNKDQWQTKVEIKLSNKLNILCINNLCEFRYTIQILKHPNQMGMLSYYIDLEENLSLGKIICRVDKNYSFCYSAILHESQIQTLLKDINEDIKKVEEYDQILKENIEHLKQTILKKENIEGEGEEFFTNIDSIERMVNDLDINPEEDQGQN